MAISIEGQIKEGVKPEMRITQEERTARVRASHHVYYRNNVGKIGVEPVFNAITDFEAKDKFYKSLFHKIGAASQGCEIVKMVSVNQNIMFR
jgi:hypothetical protein